MSDVLGIKLGESIEMLANKVTRLQPKLSQYQMTMRKTRRFYYGGCTLGMVIGCVLGMFNNSILQQFAAPRRQFSVCVPNEISDVLRWVRDDSIAVP